VKPIACTAAIVNEHKEMSCVSAFEEYGNGTFIKHKKSD